MRDEKKIDMGKTLPMTAPAEWTAGLLYFLRMFIWIRWGAVIAVTCVVAFSQMVLHLHLPYAGLYGIAGFILFYNAAFLAYSQRLKGLTNWPFLESLRQRRTVRIVALMQVNLDFLSLFALLLCSGGGENPFALMFLFHVVVASILLGKWWALIEAVIAASLIFFLALIEDSGWLFCTESFEDLIKGSAGAGWVITYGRPAVMAVTVFALFLLTSAIVKEYARRRKMVVQLTRRVEKKNRQLQEIDEMRRGLLTVATHDMKAPLSTIGSYLMALNMGYLGALEKPQKEVVEKILAKVDQLNAFISDVLSFQSIDKGEMQQSTRRLDPGSLLLEVVDSFVHKAQQEGIELIVRDLDCHQLIEADGNRLAQVFENLVSNAVKYTKDGGTVEVSGEDLGNRVRFSIRDTGVGIDEEDRIRIFGEFFRSRKVRSKIKGTGMGLAIVSRIVESHNGKVWVESELEKGSTFHVEFPVWEG